MFTSTKIDKFRRSVEKLQHGDRPTINNIFARFRRPLCCVLLLISLLCAIAFLYNSHFLRPHSTHNSSDHSSHTPQSEHVQQLYAALLEQVHATRRNATLTAADKKDMQMAENPLFVRTRSVRMLYDYVRAATRELYAAEYAADPKFHHVQCVETFSPNMKKHLPAMERSVRAFLALGDAAAGDGATHRASTTMYNQDVVRTFVRRTEVTAEMQKGLPVWPGHVGIVALRDIAADTCIGHYYGDEYLLSEFEAEFAWSVYGAQPEHPFRKKWDYYMTIPYHSFADARLAIPENVTLAIDAYHVYNYEDYVAEGGQRLSKAQSEQKRSNLEEYINDPRRQLYKPKLSRDDLRRKNSEFVYCAVDGVLQTFVVVHKQVRAGEQLFIYYGPNYG